MAPEEAVVIALGGLAPLFACVGLWFVHQRRKRAYMQTQVDSRQSTLSPSGAQAPLIFNTPNRHKLAEQWDISRKWLESYWALEERQERQPQDQWRFEPLQRYDRKLMQRMGLPNAVILTRHGQAHDVLGLAERPHFKLIQQLQFFGVIPFELNRTQAERELRWAMESPMNRQRWESRPIDPMQRCFFNMVSFSFSKTMTATEAQKVMDAILDAKGEHRTLRREDWLAFDAIYSELCSNYAAINFMIRQPKPEVVLLAFESLLREGNESMHLFIEMRKVVVRLLEIDPSLRR